MIDSAAIQKVTKESLESFSKFTDWVMAQPTYEPLTEEKKQEGLDILMGKNNDQPQ